MLKESELGARIEPKPTIRTADIVRDEEDQQRKRDLYVPQEFCATFIGHCGRNDRRYAKMVIRLKSDLK